MAAVRTPINLGTRTNKSIRLSAGLSMGDASLLTKFSKCHISMHDNDLVNDNPYSSLLMLYCGVHPVFELIERKDKRLFNN